MDQLRLTTMSMNTSMIMHTNIVPIRTAMSISIPASTVNIITSTRGNVLHTLVRHGQRYIIMMTGFAGNSLNES